MRIALAQILSGADPRDNLQLVADQAADAAAEGADLLLLPEATMRRFGLSLGDIAEPLDGPWAGGVRAIAEQHGLVIAVGMFTPAAERVRNTLLVVGPGVEAHYDKLHLFDAFGFAESDTVEAGEGAVVVRIGDLAVGFATCYDIRFPELFTTLARAGAELVCLAASWGAGPGKVDQWELLARARALDATVFVAACGQADPASVGITTVGTAPTGVGHSRVVAPDGSVLAALDGHPGMLVVDLDPERVAEARAALPVLANARSDISV